MFNPPASPTNGSEYTYGNVVWQYQNPPGVWNIKDGTLVGKDGVGVSGFRIEGNNLRFYYVYPGGATSTDINLGVVVGAGSIDTGITFMDSNDAGSGQGGTRLVLGETLQITGSGTATRGVRVTTNAARFSAGSGLTGVQYQIFAQVPIATSSVTGVASFNAVDFTVSSGAVTLRTSKPYFVLQDQQGLTSTFSLVSPSPTDHLQQTIALTGGQGINVLKIPTANSLHTMRFVGVTADYTTLGIASFRAGDFSVASGAVSLTSGIVNSVNGRTGSVALPLANTTGTTGLASFRAGDFTISTAGEVGLTSTLTNSLYVDSKTLTGYIAISSASGAGLRPVRVTSTKSNTNSSSTPDNIYVNVLDASTNENLLSSGATAGVAFYDKNDFVLTSPLGGVYGVMVSLTASAFVRQINGATGNLLVGAGDDKMVYTSTTGLTTTPNFLFDGNTLTFGGANTQMTITGPTFAFGDLTQVKGGVYTQFSESATAFSSSASNSIIEIDPSIGLIQKIKRSNLGANIRVRTASSGWKNVPDTVQSVVVYVQQIGTSHTGQFDSSIIADRSVPMFGVTGGIDVFTISRYAVTNSTGLTMGFSIAVGLTGAGLAF